MSSIDNELETELKNHLQSGEIDGFSKGNLAIFIDEPKYRFFRVVDEGYQRADVILDNHPDSDADMRIYHEVYETRSGDVIGTTRDANEVKAYPVEVGFGELVE